MCYFTALLLILAILLFIIYIYINRVKIQIIISSKFISKLRVSICQDLHEQLKNIHDKNQMIEKCQDIMWKNALEFKSFLNKGIDIYSMSKVIVCSEILIQLNDVSDNNINLNLVLITDTGDNKDE